jgi:hypothetical protein
MLVVKQNIRKRTDIYIDDLPIVEVCYVCVSGILYQAGSVLSP